MLRNGVKIMTAKELVRKIHESGGQPYWVGGCVRDSLMGCPSKDYDLVVFEMTAEELESVLSDLGAWKQYGKTQPVWVLSGVAVEISLSGTSLENDAKKRDYTLNAIYCNAMTGQLVDPLKGSKDLECRVLRMAGPASLTQDPLRIYRGFQLASRFNLEVEKDTLQKMKETSAKNIAPERIYDEFKKWILAPFPETGFHYMKKTGKFPPVLQRGREEVTEQLVKDATLYREQSSWSEMFMWAAILHCQYPEIFKGSPDQSLAERNEKESIYSKIRKDFYEFSRHHQKSKELESRIRALAIIISSDRAADYRRLSLLMKKEEAFLSAKVLRLREKMKLIVSYCPTEAPKPFVKGKDLSKLGIPKDARMGFLLKVAFQLQLEGISKHQIMDYIQKNHHIL
ncbi:MAG: CCA tRNA nucleotidyltransferase [Tindallia sp. MSAO_Bac2]|nr:MAG: CCA tRNA nucleotidyltransferase [Tindallia sp. MSAO_Bac2]